MKKHLVVAGILLLLLASVSSGQKPKSKTAAAVDDALKQTLIERETKLWDAWKNRQGGPFQESLSADTTLVSDNGVANKAEIVQFVASDACTLKSYSLTDFNLKMLGSDMALLTYKVAQEGTCIGTPIPAKAVATSLWTKRGKWWVVFHQETPLLPQ